MSRPLTNLMRRMRHLVEAPTADSDADLLTRFSRDRDESAFAALVSRHGSMVFGVCRRVLRDSHAAEDASQATFLVLARKAGSLGHPAELASWLHGVAYRVAMKARCASRRQGYGQSRLGQDSPDHRYDPLAEVSARPKWGLHRFDVSFVQGNILDLIAAQTASWSKRQASAAR